METARQLLTRDANVLAVVNLFTLLAGIALLWTLARHAYRFFRRAYDTSIRQAIMMIRDERTRLIEACSNDVILLLTVIARDLFYLIFVATGTIICLVPVSLRQIPAQDQSRLEMLTSHPRSIVSFIMIFALFAMVGRLFLNGVAFCRGVAQARSRLLSAASLRDQSERDQSSK